jgi:hypothetical protein
VVGRLAEQQRSYLAEQFGSGLSIRSRRDSPSWAARVSTAAAVKRTEKNKNRLSYVPLASPSRAQYPSHSAFDPMVFRPTGNLRTPTPGLALDEVFEVDGNFRRPLESSADCAEGIAAFMQRRKSVFKGQ